MEQEIEKQESKTITDYLNAEVGENTGSHALPEAEVVIASVTEKTKNKDDKVMANSLIQVHCKHPDKDDLIKITQIQKISDGRVINVALFVSVDKEGLFTKDSGIAYLLNFMKCKTLKELETKKINTVKESETSNYMALKCY